MIYTVKVSNLGVKRESVVTTATEIAAIAEAVVRVASNGAIPDVDSPGGEYYLSWKKEMEEFTSLSALKAYLFDQGLVVEVYRTLGGK